MSLRVGRGNVDVPVSGKKYLTNYVRLIVSKDPLKTDAGETEDVKKDDKKGDDQKNQAGSLPWSYLNNSSDLENFNTIQWLMVPRLMNFDSTLNLIEKKSDPPTSGKDTNTDLDDQLAKENIRNRDENNFLDELLKPQGNIVPTDLRFKTSFVLPKELKAKQGYGITYISHMKKDADMETSPQGSNRTHLKNMKVELKNAKERINKMSLKKDTLSLKTVPSRESILKGKKQGNLKPRLLAKMNGPCTAAYSYMPMDTYDLKYCHKAKQISQSLNACQCQPKTQVEGKDAMKVYGQENKSKIKPRINVRHVSGLIAPKCTPKASFVKMPKTEKNPTRKLKKTLLVLKKKKSFIDEKQEVTIQAQQKYNIGYAHITQKPPLIKNELWNSSLEASKVLKRIPKTVRSTKNHTGSTFNRNLNENKDQMEKVVSSYKKSTSLKNGNLVNESGIMKPIYQKGSSPKASEFVKVKQRSSETPAKHNNTKIFSNFAKSSNIVRKNPSIKHFFVPKIYKTRSDGTHCLKDYCMQTRNVGKRISYIVLTDNKKNILVRSHVKSNSNKKPIHTYNNNPINFNNSNTRKPTVSVRHKVPAGRSCPFNKHNHI